MSVIVHNDTAKKSNNQSSSAKPDKKEHKLLGFLKKKFRNEIKQMGKDAIPPTAGTSHESNKTDTSRHSSSVNLSPKRDSVHSLYPPAKNTKCSTCNPFPKLIENGQIEIGYDYGLLPFYVPGNYPSGGIKTDGQMSMDIFSLPINATYYYSTFRNVTGLNNYFKISFDAERYKKKLLGKVESKESSLTSKEDSLKKERSQLLGKLSYLDYLKQKVSGKGAFPQLSVPNTNTMLPKNDINTGDFSKDASKAGNISSDTSALSKSTGGNNDSTKSAEKGASSSSQLSKDEKNDQKRIKDSLKHIDSTEKVYSKRLEQVEKLIDVTQKEIKQCENAKNSYGTSSFADKEVNRGLTPAQRFFATTNKFEIGMVYPSFSTFMVNNLPLNGFQVEKQIDHFYFATAGGITINNLLMTNNMLQNNLTLARNLYNFFDYGNVSAGRRVIAIKAGYGEKNGNHFYIGYMRGWGLLSYTDSAYVSSPNSPGSREQNEVVELDGKIMLGTHQSLSAVVAKSLVYPSTGPDSARLLDFSSHTLAGLLQYKAQLVKTGTTVTLTTRYVQPFFYSFGVGYMQSDHLRYEARVDQILGSKLKLTCFYRNETDNLYNLLPYKNTLYNGGITLSLKLTKHLVLKGTYNPIFQNVSTFDNPTILHNRNEISQVTLSHVITGSKVSLMNNIYCSYYRLNSGDTLVNNYTNAGYTGVLQIGKSRWTFSANYFNIVSTDTSSSHTLLLAQEASFRFFRKLQLTGALKYSWSNVQGPPWGWSLQVNYLLSKCLTLDAIYEKPVMGDFYNNYPITLIKKFPYYCSFKIGYLL